MAKKKVQIDLTGSSAGLEAALKTSSKEIKGFATTAQKDLDSVKPKSFLDKMAASAKEMQMERRSSGYDALERMGGGGISGLANFGLEAAGLGGIGMAVDMSGKLVAGLADGLSKLGRGADQNWQDITLEIGKGLPILGEWVKAGVAINDVFTGVTHDLETANNLLKSGAAIFADYQKGQFNLNMFGASPDKKIELEANAEYSQTQAKINEERKSLGKAEDYLPSAASMGWHYLAGWTGITSTSAEEQTNAENEFQDQTMMDRSVLKKRDEDAKKLRDLKIQQGKDQNQYANAQTAANLSYENERISDQTTLKGLTDPVAKWAMEGKEAIAGILQKESMNDLRIKFDKNLSPEEKAGLQQQNSLLGKQIDAIKNQLVPQNLLDEKNKPAPWQALKLASAEDVSGGRYSGAAMAAMEADKAAESTAEAEVKKQTPLQIRMADALDKLNTTVADAASSAVPLF